MTDARAATDRINEAMAEENEKLSKEVQELRAMLGRPLTVNVQSPDSGVLNQIGQYLPQLTYMATNISSVASAIQASNSMASSIVDKLQKQNELLERIAVATEEPEMRIARGRPKGGQ